ncbi:hypothetical protein GCM10025865_21080 [Paraoerskovia sediminicola]|uniref:Glycosyltransferase 2-like domain-containing protein n=1 Tax=Paraoerskovia sediminicola TaxID=1138587 RepID=A0ABN6XD71_9CELL|nr:glycosyltransferase [Paraoerskovia sediminicola]BDZ42809.1 hypothetical protein GCM10025865_21080 [Paraoerskovia sediminicola]
MIVLVPAYEPDHRLVDLVADLRAAAPELPVVVVDDGSGPAYADWFERAGSAGATVLVDGADDGSRNHGKGHALRLGVRHVLDAHPGHGVVCADSDGQHTVPDILAVAARAEREDRTVAAGQAPTMVLGGVASRGASPSAAGWATP